MDNFIDVTISNERVLESLVSGLSQIDRDKSIKHGLAKGGKVLSKGGMRRLKARMKSGRQGHTGNLLSSFMVRVKRTKPGVLVGFRGGVGGGNQSHLVDFGPTSRTRKRRGVYGKSTGVMPANYFWDDTRKGDIDDAHRAINTGLVQFVEKVKAKL